MRKYDNDIESSNNIILEPFIRYRRNISAIFFATEQKQFLKLSLECLPETSNESLQYCHIIHCLVYDPDFSYFNILICLIPITVNC